jgi:hypothetical protein
MQNTSKKQSRNVLQMWVSWGLSSGEVGLEGPVADAVKTEEEEEDP